MFPFAQRLPDRRQSFSNSRCWGCEIFRHFSKPQCQAFLKLIRAWKRLCVRLVSNHGLTKTKVFTKRTVSLWIGRPGYWCLFISKNFKCPELKSLIFSWTIKKYIIHIFKQFHQLRCYIQKLMCISCCCQAKQTCFNLLLKNVNCPHLHTVNKVECAYTLRIYERK